MSKCSFLNEELDNAMKLKQLSSEFQIETEGDSNFTKLVK